MKGMAPVRACAGVRARRRCWGRVLAIEAQAELGHAIAEGGSTVSRVDGLVGSRRESKNA